MAREHDVLRRVLSRRARRHDWHAVLQATHRIMERRTLESERLLARVLAFEGEVVLAGGYLPHAMPAADMLRSLAIQTLARWNKRKHRGAIARIRDTTGSHHLAAIAKANL